MQLRLYLQRRENTQRTIERIAAELTQRLCDEYMELLEPDDRNHQIYQEFFDLYKSIHSHVQDDFKSLQSLLRRTNS
jgi:hypothetical protein